MTCRTRSNLPAALLWAALGGSWAVGQTAPPAAPADTAAAAPAAPLPTLYIREFRVLGAKELPAVEVQEAVYPFMGPGRTADDVEQARAALEKAYQDKGYQGASVQIPDQQGRKGVVFLQVSVGTVANLRVKGSRYYLPSAIKKQAQAMAEGQALNFNSVTRDIVALNTLPDRQISPELRPGLEPGTLDVDLIVKDKFPLHGSVEFNNSANANTTPSRLTVSANYNNLWQLGHTLGASYTVAPERPDDAEIYSAYYIFRFPWAENFSLMLQGRKQYSNLSVSSGDLTVTFPNIVVAPGETYGLRGIFTLPPLKEYYHSLTVGVDYSHYENEIFLGGPALALIDSSPFTYYPVSASYSGTWARKSSTTDMNVGVTFGFRGIGSTTQQIGRNRFDADANFIKLRGDFSHTQDLPKGFEGFVRMEGQVTNQPLVNTEQIGGGGLQSVRGYLESEILADNGIYGTLEFRSPNLLGPVIKRKKSEDGKEEPLNDDNEWRIYLFGDAGAFTLRSALPEQETDFTLASIGIGTRMRLFGHFNGSLDAALPLFNGTNVKAHDSRLLFRVWADF